MAILKAPPLQPKNETIQLRVSQELKFRLTRYAEFIHATTSYVMSEALNRIFEKDRDFKAWLEQYPNTADELQNETNSTTETIRKS
ncbi:MAG TPA: hypothetical protein VJP02_15390 [Candidatus Sulfotelmatobacter sp.]|nr:hypothetical protein [Candidatus Sulfotelmatobacter sp.]